MQIRHQELPLLGGVDRYVYRSEEFDEPTGMICYDMRWFDPRVGEFLSPEPIADDPATNYRAMEDA